MKTILLYLAIITSVTVNAAILTVDNNTNLPGSPGQYNTITDAISAASDGDTIYVHGSTLNYENDVVINKELTLIGPGFNPQKQNSLTANIGIFRVMASNVKIIGFIIQQVIDNNFSGSNIYILRNKLGALYMPYSTGLIVENNLFIFIGENRIYSGVIRNNIFGESCYIMGNGSSTLSITNNLFINPQHGGFVSVTNSIIENNIFYCISVSALITNNTFNNNLTFACGGSNPTFPPVGNMGSGNILDQDPLFLDFLNGDYRIQAGSPALNAGLDGSDIGPTGGSAPITVNAGKFGGEPRLPQVQQFTINNNSVPPGGTLNVTVKGIKKN